VSSSLREHAGSTVGPILLVLLCGSVLWLVSGVGLADILLFLLYEAVFIVGPGWVVYGALRARSDSVERLAYGWALGYALEIGVFALTAALNVRSLFVTYPALVAAFAVWRGSKSRPPAGARAAREGRWNWIVAGIAVMALLIVASSLFPTNPLPATVPRVTYFLDNVFQISLAAEALHHWPITDPTVAGAPFPYHTFVHMHMAAVAQTTGIALPVVVLRLVPLALVAVFAFQMAVAGTRLGGRRWIGPVAVLLVLLSGEVDLDPRGGPISVPFVGTFSVGLWYSPTFLLGLVFFVPIVFLLVDLVTERDGPRSWRDWTLLAVFFAGADGSKAAVPPVVIAGLALFLFARRRFDRAGMGALLLSSAVFAGFLATMYRGGDAGMRIHFPASVGSAVLLVWNALSWLPHPLAVAAGVLVGFVGLFGAPLSGLVWFAHHPSTRLTPTCVLLLCLFAAGLVPYFFIEEPGVSQLFFTEYGYVGAAFVSATGIYWLWQGSRGESSQSHTLVAAFAIVWPVTLLLLAEIPLLLTSSDRTLYLIWYGSLDSIVLTFGLALVRSRSARRGVWVRLLLITVLGASAVNVPLDIGPHLVQGWRDGNLYTHGGTGLTTGLYRGLAWIRDRTRPEDVIAVSNYSVDQNAPEYDDIYYSAFAERRTFLEGWFYTMKTLGRGPRYHISRTTTPYPDRLRLNDAVFRHGDRAALRTLIRQYGVRYLLVDRVHGNMTSEVSALGRLAFSNSDIAIYAVSLRR
jgi:hypothetical protein